MKNMHLVYGEKYPAYYTLAAMEGISEMCDLAQIEYKVSLVELNEANAKAIDGSFYNKRNGKYNQSLFYGGVFQCLHEYLDIKISDEKPLIYLLKGDMYVYNDPNQPYYDWVFGGANVFGGIMTPYRIDRRFKSEPPELRAEMFKTIVMHEIGHTLGLLPESAPNYTRSKSPIFHGHCRHGYCIMSQNTRAANEKQRTESRLSRQNPICDDCLNYLIERNRAR
jgi:predicted Zn-dependent protease